MFRLGLDGFQFDGIRLTVLQHTQTTILSELWFLW